MNLQVRLREMAVCREALIKHVKSLGYSDADLKRICKKYIYEHSRLDSIGCYKYPERRYACLSFHLDQQYDFEDNNLKVALQALGKMRAFSKRGGYLWR